MQDQRQEIGRKQKKMFMRERSGNTRQLQRHRSKDTNETSPFLEPLSPKPKYMIMGLRDQLSSLREEVSKLSKSNKPQISPEKHLSPESQDITARQKKSINSYYFESSPTKKSSQFRCQPVNNSVGKLSHATFDNMSSSADFQLIAEELRQVQKQNEQLRIKNQDLRAQMGQVGDQLKKEYQSKIKQMQFQKERRAFSKQRDNDRTVVIQKQNSEHNKSISQLKEQVKQYQQNLNNLIAQNDLLKKQCLKYEQLERQVKVSAEQTMKKQEKIKVQAQTIVNMTQILQKYDKQLKGKEEQLAQAHQLIYKLEQQKIVNLKTIDQLIFKCSELEEITTSLKAKMGQLKEAGQQNAAQTSNQTIKDMQTVIDMQQRSMDNYIHDIQYLQKQVSKNAHLKPLTESLEKIVQGLNEQCITIRLQFLNFKQRQQ